MTTARIDSATRCSPKPSTTTSCHPSGVVCMPPTPPSLDARPVPDGAEGASLLAALAHHATAAHEPVRALRAWIAAARAASDTYAFAESVRAFERAIELWDAVPADDRPTGADPVLLYHEASLSAMVGEPAGAGARAVARSRPPGRPGPRAGALGRRQRTAGAGVVGIRRHAGLDADPGSHGRRHGARRSIAEPVPVSSPRSRACYMLGRRPRRAIPAAERRDPPRPGDRRDTGRGRPRDEHPRNEHRRCCGRCAEGLPISRDVLRPQPRRWRRPRPRASLCQPRLVPLDLRRPRGESRGRPRPASLGPASSARTGSTAASSPATSIETSIDLGRWDEAERLVDELLAAALRRQPHRHHRRRPARSSCAAVAGDGPLRCLPRAEHWSTDAGCTVHRADVRGPHGASPDRRGSGGGRERRRRGSRAHRGRPAIDYYSIELAAMRVRAEADVAGWARARREEAAAAAAVERAHDGIVLLRAHA